MKTLIIDKDNSELRYQGNNVTVYCNDKRINSVPVNQLERVIVSPHVIITAGVLGIIAEHHVTLLVLNARFPQRTAHLSSDYSGNTERRLAQYRLSQQDGFCLPLASQLVQLKIARQRALLVRAAHKRPDLRRPLTKASAALTALLQRICTATNPSLATLNGLEGAAARVYFQDYTQLFADSLQFNARNRRPPKDPVNAILSLSYTLLYHEAVNALKIYALDPALGIYHQPCYGRQSLACDLIEPIRPYLDLWIWRLFAHQTLTASHFCYQEDACFLTDAGKPLFYQQFFAHIKPIKRLLRQYARLAAKQLDEAR